MKRFHLFLTLIIATLAVSSAEPASDLGSALLERILEVRAEHELAPVKVSKTLTKVAQSHADEMASEGYFDHKSPHDDHSYPEDRAEKAGYDWGVIRENLFKTPTSEKEKFVAEALELWLKSHHHRDNLLHKDVKDIGVGVCTLKSGEKAAVILLGREQ